MNNKNKEKKSNSKDEKIILKSKITGNSFSLKRILSDGGFGEIHTLHKNKNYVAKIGKQQKSSKAKKKEDTGIFLERSIYQKLKKNKDYHLYGIPELYDFGKDDLYGYYIIITRFSYSLSHYLEVKNNITVKKVKNIAVSILDSLEFIYNTTKYVHLDLKPDNIMFKNKKLYLVDFGMCTKVVEEEYSDPKKARNGTRKYISRDSINGIVSRKADLESLLYIILTALNIELPDYFEKVHFSVLDKKQINDNWDKIKRNKENFWNTFKNNPEIKSVPYVYNFMTLVEDIKPNEEIDYDSFKKISIK